MTPLHRKATARAMSWTLISSILPYLVYRRREDEVTLTINAWHTVIAVSVNGLTLDPSLVNSCDEALTLYHTLTPTR